MFGRAVLSGQNNDAAMETRVRDGGRLFSPSAARNAAPILEAFKAHMPRAGAVLEIASGTGEHAVHIARASPLLRWAPGDPDERSRASIRAWTAYSGLKNIAPPHAINVEEEGWATRDDGPIAGIVAINMIHIAPFRAMEGLLAGAGALLAPGGRLFLYGPFLRRGRHTAPSNAAFDKSLKARNPDWGVRDLDDEVLPLATKAGLILATSVTMPANNLSVIFEKGAERRP